MAGEEWARRIIERELKRPVLLHDDGSAPSLYDLRIGPARAPEVAIECVGAVDAIFTETWNIGPAKGAWNLQLKGDWGIEIEATARVKELKRGIERLLHQLEDRAIHDIRTDHWLRWQDAALFDQLESLGITHANCYLPKGTGKVNLWMQGIGGAVDDQGAALPSWVGEFLRDPARQDVVLKLERSGAPDRHAFVIVSFKGAPWNVESYLSGDMKHLPNLAPTLPPEVMRVWVVSTMGLRGVRWDGSSWRLFEARQESK